LTRPLLLGAGDLPVPEALPGWAPARTAIADRAGTHRFWTPALPGALASQRAEDEPAGASEKISWWRWPERHRGSPQAVPETGLV